MNSRLRFQHVAVGYRGSIHDARVLRVRGIFDLAENEEILSARTRMVNGGLLKPMLVGDSAYPLKNWLIKPFSNRGRLSPQKRRFNEKLSAMRSVIERAFGLLKKRWRLLLKKIEQSHTSVPRSVTAACVLHNFCVMQGDSFDDDNDRPSLDDQNDADEDDEAQDGSATRQTMLDYLLSQGVL